MPNRSSASLPPSLSPSSEIAKTGAEEHIENLRGDVQGLQHNYRHNQLRRQVGAAELDRRDPSFESQSSVLPTLSITQIFVMVKCCYSGLGLSSVINKSQDLRS